MKRNLLTCFTAVAFLLAQSCNKTNNSKKTTATFKDTGPEGTMLSISGAGDHGTFEVISALNGLAGEIAGVSLANGGTGDVEGYTGVSHQKWRITYVGNGYFQVMNMGSGKLLQSYTYQLSQVPIQNSADSSDDQLWSISSTGQNTVRVVNKKSGLALTAPPSSGGLITLSAYTGAIAQTWNYVQLADDSYRDDAVVNFFHRPKVTNTTVSFDQGNSIALSYGANNGKSLWIGEDSYGANLMQNNGLFSCNQIFNYHNSALLQPASHSWNPLLTPNIMTTNSPISPIEIVASPGDHNSTYSWPGDGIEIGSHVLIYTYESAKGSIPTNQVFYDFTEPADGGVNWGKGLRDTISHVSGQTTVVFSGQPVKSNDGYIYDYGSFGVFLSDVLIVARFLPGDPTHWTFWNGTNWAATLPSSNNSYNAAAVTVLNSSGVPQTVVQANTVIAYLNGKYVMMQMDLGYFCDINPHAIYMSTSNSPTGPFTAPKTVFSIEDRINGHVAKFYTPAIHPEFNNGNNELLVTYCLNYNAQGSPCSTNTCTDNGYMDPNFYQVKGVRIPYSQIGL